MKKSYLGSAFLWIGGIIGVVAVSVLVTGALGNLLPEKARAAGAMLPTLASASTFSVLAQTLITGTSAISGDVGMNSSGAGITALTTANVAGTIYATDLVAPSEGILSASVQADASAEFTTGIPGQSSTSSIGPALDALVVTSGVYDIGAGRLNGGVLTLDGPGVYIFRASSDLISSGSINLINGARACDVFWRVQTLATINGSSFVGTILAGTGVHFGAGVTLDGRALAVGGDVTMLGDTIIGPTCTTPAPAPATLHVIKQVINISGTASSSDFMVHVTSATSTLDVAGSPQAGTSTPGTLYTLSPGTYSVSEDPHPSLPTYTQTFGLDCVGGSFTLASGDDKICTMINTDIPPPPPVVPAASGGGGANISLIGIVKVPTPLALPTGPGLVTYNYRVWNVGGPQALTEISVADDVCSPVLFLSGDSNGNGKLDQTENWNYSCATTLATTTTNTAVATGYSDNSIHQIAVATALATVVVGASELPPIINIIKEPDRLTPLPLGGGEVTYTYTVTNPGVVPLHAVAVTDDKCPLVSRVSGDTNGDGLLDPAEAWVYTCRTNVTVSTRNVATAKGSANGFVALGYAFATVLIGVPGLPNTGFPPR